MRPDRETLIAKLRETAARLGTRTVTHAEFRRHTGFGVRAVARHFSHYAEFVEAAGLESSPVGKPIADEVLLGALRDAISRKRRVLTVTEFARLGGYHINTYRKRWGSWHLALAALIRWLEEREPDFEHLPTLKAALVYGRVAAPASGERGSAEGRTCGRVIDCGSLQRAPLNEQGVVYLFGMLAPKLGFMVEQIGTAFPDCLAHRRLDGIGERWRRVRIEFEHRSRDFVEHGHPPEGCDLIVCWEHNWPECPLEVIELRKEIRVV